MFKNDYLARVYDEVSGRSAGETEFLQAVREVLESLEAYVEKHPELEQQGILERMVEPERFIQFRVSWVDDAGQGACEPRLPRAVQLRHRPVQGRPAPASFRHARPSSSSWALSRSSKTALPACPWAAARAAAILIPKGKSDAEIMRFCQSFMTELSKHIGAVYRRARRRHRRGRAGDRLYVRPVQTPAQRS